MKIILVLILALISTSTVFSQGKGSNEPNMKQVKDVKSTSAPVTHAEAQAVFAKAWGALAKGLKAKGVNPVKLPSDKNPVTKNEVLSAFKAIVEQTRPLFKRSASKVAYNPSRVRKDMDLQRYGRLIQDGFVMPVGPIATGKDGGLSTFEFGDAVGVLLLRIADLSHMPSRKFSPGLMAPGG